MEGKMINGFKDKSLTYVVTIVKGVFINLVPMPLCVGVVITEIHVIAPGQCIKPYENFTIIQRKKAKLCVSFETEWIEIKQMRSHIDYQPGKEDSYNIGVITVGSTNYKR